MYPQNHDMDDLFRRAAARYPLVTGKGDWEDVALKLKFPARPIVGEANSRRRKYYALLLLLIPGVFLFHNSTREPYVATDTGKSASSPILAEQAKMRQPGSFMPGQPVVAVPVQSTPANTIPASISKERNRVVATLPESVPFNYKTGNTEETVHKRPFNITERVPDREKQVPAKNGLYLGGVAGLEFSNVKRQSFTSPGYNVGVLLGYRFNKHWSVETGISWIRKNYFTRGEYFSMNKLESSMPGMEMVTVKGRLSLFEIPYKLKYNFLLKERSNFFIIAGGSSNLYIRESNNYSLRHNGSYESQEASYTNVHCSPLCDVHFSAGFERNLNNKWIRLEPYIKLPLRKVGMGSVPLLSAGMNVSIYGFLGGQRR